VSEALRVLIADDQRVVRDGLAMIVGMLAGIEVVGLAADGAQAVELARTQSADVVVMDLHMPVMDGVQATREIRAALPATQVLVLTTYADDDTLLQALRADARGYLTKDASAEEIEQAIRSVHAGQTHLEPAIQQRLVSAALHAQPPAAATPHRPGSVQRRDLGAARRLARHGQDARQPDLRQDRRTRPGSGRALRLPARLGVTTPHDGRFAPSPTGPLHLGSLRTALAAWLFARSRKGAFLLRIEDLDPDRSRRAFEAGQIADLAALGIDWDAPPVRQSERRALYEDALAELNAQDRLYPCFCTRAEIRQAASAPHGDVPMGFYPGTCRVLTDAQRRAREREGRPSALRVRAEGQRIAFDDGMLGRCDGVVDDFVVRRSDGVPAYQLAVIVDDAHQGIGEVVRGADLADSTPRQILLAGWLGLSVPRYAHVPLVLGPDGARLAKRHGSVTLAQRGEPVSATLALLAHTLGLARERARVDHAQELVAEFEPDRIPREPVVIPAPGPGQTG
jgi:glutamyl-tRNA synthetase